jgi:hypothetical protein
MTMSGRCSSHVAERHPGLLGHGTSHRERAGSVLFSPWQKGQELSRA